MIRGPVQLDDSITRVFGACARATARVFAAALVIGLSAVPGTGARAAMLPAPVERTLGNGLRVAVFSNTRLEMVQIQLLVPAGLSAEPAGAEGVAYVTAEMLRRGTTSRDPRTFDADVQRTGGSLTGSVGRDYATQNGVFLARDFETGMELMSDAVNYPIFDNDELLRVKSQALRQLGQTQQGAGATADDQVWRLVFGSHPYERSPYGAWDAVIGLEAERVRAFWTERYRPDHAVLAIAGDVTPERAFAVAEEWFGRWTGHGEAAPVTPAPAALKGPRIRIVDRPNSRAEIRIGFVAPARNAPDEVAVLAASSLFGGAPASRPGGDRTVAGRDVRVGYAPLASAGLVSISMNAPPDSAGLMVRALFDKLTAIEQPASSADLASVKRSLVNAFPMSLETLASWTSSWLNADFVGAGSDFFDRYPQRIAALEPPVVAAAAQRWLDPSRSAIVVLGPAAVLRPQLTEFGAVEVVKVELPASATATGETPGAAGSTNSAREGLAGLGKGAPTVAQRTRGRALVTRLVTAHGGLAKLRAIHDSRLDAIVTINVGNQLLDGKFVQARREPDRMVYVTEISGIATRQTLVGNKAWQLLGSDSVAKDMDASSTEALKSGFASDLHHLLLAAADPKSRVWSLGPQRVDSVRVLAVAVEAVGQGTRVLYLNPVTYRLIAFDQGGASGMLARRKFSDFRNVGGIQWPYHEERLLNGETIMQLDVQDMRINTGVPDSAFNKP